jgi:hypothetical protein
MANFWFCFGIGVAAGISVCLLIGIMSVDGDDFTD